MKEKVLDAFRELGFSMEQMEGTEWYSFNYEGKTFFYLPNSDDESFLSIAIPGICDLEEDGAIKFVALIEQLNSAPKYVKAYRVKDSIWLFYERELLGEEDLPLVISRMIRHLEAASYLARNVLATLESDEEVADADDNQEDRVVTEDIETIETIETIEETEDTDN